MKKEKKDLTQANTAVKSRDKKKIFMTIGIVVACLAVIYVGFGIFFQSHFCFGTTIDGIKAGGRSVEKMEQLITEEIDSYVLDVASSRMRTGGSATAALAIESSWRCPWDNSSPSPLSMVS